MSTSLRRYDDLVAAGMQPDLITANTLLKSCMRCSDAGTAAALWEDMQARGLKPDNYTLTTLVKVWHGEHINTHTHTQS